MGMIFNLSLRNLWRQKRRNLLLGIGIGFGMMIFVIANSFAHGMVDILINNVVANMFGHLVISGTPGNHSFGHTLQVIRDKQRMERLVRQNIKKEDLTEVIENLGVFGRVIGNGAADNVVISGLTGQNEQENLDYLRNTFMIVQGGFRDFSSRKVEYPVVVSQEKAKSLKVKVHDTIRLRVPVITGQIQAARLTVVAIVKPANSFLNFIFFMDGNRLKRLLGYQPWEAAGLRIVLKNPKQTAQKYADILQRHLKPQIITILGNSGAGESRLVAFKNEDWAKKILSRRIRIIQGNPQDGFGKNGVMISRQLAHQLNLSVGGVFHYQYQTKYRGLHEETFQVSAIYDASAKLGGDIVLMNGEKIYNIYERYLPAHNDWQYIKNQDPIYPVLATEWKLLPRSRDSEALQKKHQAELRVKTDQTKMEVVTMYEGASDVLKLEGVLNLITVIGVLVLFFIILIGVINTLRMTIKERTREIGTVRAIGMQKKDIRNEFILETLFLTAISCALGIAAGITAMQVLSLIPFNVDNGLSMILKEKHLFFKLDPLGICGNFIFILVITGVTAYFPAQRAANLPAVDALRHYE